MKARFPYVLRSIASDAGVLKAMVVIISDFAWRRAATLVNSAFESGAIQVLRPAMEMQSMDPGVSSTYRDVQGLPDDASDKELKKDMMAAIYEANIELQNKAEQDKDN